MNTTLVNPLWEKMKLAGYTSVITGAGKGLGRSIAIGLAQAGSHVVLMSRTLKDLEDVKKEIEKFSVEVMTIVADVTDSASMDESVDKIMQRFGRIDVLAHAAGSSLPKNKSVFDLSDKDWAGLIDANLTATFFICRAVGKVMVEKGQGSIINVASVAGQRGRPRNSGYSAAKAGVINFSRALAMEWASKGVRVNVISPGRFLTPLTQPEMSDKEKYTAWVNKVPLGRLGDPDEMKEITVWLASKASSFVTGSTIVIDGGVTLL